MSKILFKAFIVFCLINVSCKTNIDEKNSDECELFNIGNYKFYNPRVYDQPVVFEKGSHSLMNKQYVPIWYNGYCAVNLPSYFKSKEGFIKYIADADVKKKSVVYYENVYKANKANLKGMKSHFHEDYHLLFRGSVSVKNVNSGNKYLLVAGRSYISNPTDYDKNTEFYSKGVKDMFAFLEEDGIYKSVDIDLVVGNFTETQYDKVFDILSADRLVKSVCTETVNTLKKSDFKSFELPSWVVSKSEAPNWAAASE